MCTSIFGYGGVEVNVLCEASILIYQALVEAILFVAPLPFYGSPVQPKFFLQAAIM